jgi:hypothetical protein
MQLTIHKSHIYTVVFDLAAILFIYLVPTISHLLSFPLYLFEPMRIMLILSIAHYRKVNAYIIALTLPLFSYILSSHPIPPKMILISFELMLNVFLFYFLTKRFRKVYLGIILSIILSKIAYYIMKFTLLSFTLLEGSLISTPLYLQAIVIGLLSFYVIMFQNRSTLNDNIN